jgi:RimJ/RimL family protein N-acetyltransferase
VLTTLADGTRLEVRPIRPDDKPRLERAFSLLSDASILQRFLTPKPRLTTRELAYLCEVDGVNHVALVALPAGQPNRILAVARFVRLADDPEAAEAAVIVGDAFQRKGLGTRLGLLLADEARARGIRRFTASMLGENVAAHRLLRRISSRLHEGRPANGVQEMVAELAA